MAGPVPAGHLCGGHCLESSLFLNCWVGHKPPRLNRGQQEARLFIQVPLAKGTTLPAGLDSDHRANDDTTGGVLLYLTEGRAWGKTQTKPGESRLQSDLPSFHVCGAEQIK